MNAYTGSVPDTEPAGQWLTRAACLGRWAEMHPDNDEHEIANAKAICKPCPVARECFWDAVRTDDNKWGIRAGLRASERRATVAELKARGADQKTAKALETVAESAVEQPRPKRTFQSLWDQRSRPLPDGHTEWTGSTPVALKGHYYTPTQIAFRVDRKRPPVGIVRRTCEVDGCVLPAHLMDQAERDARDRCGSRPGYRRHLERGEEPCGPCRQANADADNRLRRTGTSVAAA
ncbi:WhiB family transcriptional regulator [Streptomyces sp. NPDC059441]|uniref:WhiB family transcriptional regulator n=1 Tax=Streptomyces sp. NPDC059441 TaxID=3346829 RepID=UPI00367FC592